MTHTTKVADMTAKDTPLPLLLFLILGGLLALAAGCAGDGGDHPPQHETPRNVRVLELSASAIEEFFELAGPVSPVRGADLAAEESGPVVRINADKGTVVAAGAVLLEQDRRILAAEMAAARSNLETRAYNFDKVQQLFQAGKVSEIELLEVTAARDLAAAQAEVAARRYERAAIKAPFAGVVVQRYAELGQFLAPGIPAARVIDPYTLKLEAYLTDEQVPWVASGMECRIVLGDQQEAAPGTVTFVSLEADRATGKFRVEIEIPNRDLVLRSGVIGRAQLPKDTASGVVIPRDAVLPGKAGPQVFVVDGDRARLRNLELGSDQGLMVMVTGGLRPGDLLVVRGQRELRDGSLVAVTETATDPDGSLPGDPDIVRTQRVGGRVGGDESVREDAR